ncbi:hypothetical protein BH18ACT4_BH18ACT4_04780 [soil metagenome]
MAAREGMAGIVDQTTLAGLEQLSGAGFDNTFVFTMIVHHKGADFMAEIEIREGRFAGTIALAEQIGSTHRREIDEMVALLAQLPN